MAKIEKKFESEKSAKAAKVVLKKSLSAVGSSKISLKVDSDKLNMEISDKSPAKKKAAVYGAKRLSGMLSEIDREI